MRIDKYLANNTNNSRSEIKKKISKKKVEVNGNKITDPSYKIDNNDEVTLYGIPILDKSNIIIKIDKPKGFITTTSTDEGQSVMDLIPDEYKGLNLLPIGRLDKDTTGLLLFTNNKKLIHKMTSSKNKVLKVYEVTLADEVKDEYKEIIQSGIELKDGYITKPGLYEVIDNFKCKVSIYDGKYHQIKRMFGALGNKVIDLRRIAFGEYKI